MSSSLPLPPLNAAPDASDNATVEEKSVSDISSTTSSILPLSFSSLHYSSHVSRVLSYCRCLSSDDSFHIKIELEQFQYRIERIFNELSAELKDHQKLIKQLKEKLLIIPSLQQENQFLSSESSSLSGKLSFFQSSLESRDEEIQKIKAEYYNNLLLVREIIIQHGMQGIELFHTPHPPSGLGSPALEVRKLPSQANNTGRTEETSSSALHTLAHGLNDFLHSFELHVDNRLSKLWYRIDYVQKKYIRLNSEQRRKEERRKESNANNSMATQYKQLERALEDNEHTEMNSRLSRRTEELRHELEQREQEKYAQLNKKYPQSMAQLKQFKEKQQQELNQFLSDIEEGRYEKKIHPYLLNSSAFSRANSFSFPFNNKEQNNTVGERKETEAIQEGDEQPSAATASGDDYSSYLLSSSFSLPFSRLADLIDPPKQKKIKKKSKQNKIKPNAATSETTHTQPSVSFKRLSQSMLSPSPPVHDAARPTSAAARTNKLNAIITTNNTGTMEKTMKKKSGVPVIPPTSAKRAGSANTRPSSGVVPSSPALALLSSSTSSSSDVPPVPTSSDEIKSAAPPSSSETRTDQSETEIIGTTEPLSALVTQQDNTRPSDAADTDNTQSVMGTTEKEREMNDDRPSTAAKNDSADKELNDDIRSSLLPVTHSINDIGDASSPVESPVPGVVAGASFSSSPPFTMNSSFVDEDDEILLEDQCTQVGLPHLFYATFFSPLLEIQANLHQLYEQEHQKILHQSQFKENQNQKKKLSEAQLFAAVFERFQHYHKHSLSRLNTFSSLNSFLTQMIQQNSQLMGQTQRNQTQHQHSSSMIQSIHQQPILFDWGWSKKEESDNEEANAQEYSHENGFSCAEEDLNELQSILHEANIATGSTREEEEKTHHPIEKSLIPLYSSHSPSIKKSSVSHSSMSPVAFSSLSSAAASSPPPPPTPLSSHIGRFPYHELRPTTASSFSSSSVYKRLATPSPFVFKSFSTTRPSTSSSSFIRHRPRSTSPPPHATQALLQAFDASFSYLTPPMQTKCHISISNSSAVPNDLFSLKRVEKLLMDLGILKNSITHTQENNTPAVSSPPASSLMSEQSYLPYPSSSFVSSISSSFSPIQAHTAPLHPHPPITESSLEKSKSYYLNYKKMKENKENTLTHKKDAFF